MRASSAAGNRRPGSKVATARSRLAWPAFLLSPGEVGFAHRLPGYVQHFRKTSGNSRGRVTTSCISDLRDLYF